MAKVQTQLTPKADTTPAVVSILRELSGDQWCARFPGSTELSALTPEFRPMAEAFKAAMESAGATVHVTSTFRPAERAYLMHWSWKIAKNQVKASEVPELEGVYIEWVHASSERSKSAAQQMVTKYGTGGLGFPPALAGSSLHPLRQAIDMSISWDGSLSIQDANGRTIEINSSPKTGMNAELKIIGASYGVMKWIGGTSDKPHWSATGH